MHWLGRSAKRCLPEGEDTVMVLGARDKHEPPAAGDRGCWHRWGVFSPKSEPRWGKTPWPHWDGEGQRVRGGEWELVGVRGQRSRWSKSQAVYKPPRAPHGRLNVPGELQHQARMRGSHHVIPTTATAWSPSPPLHQRPHHHVPITTTTMTPPAGCPHHHLVPTTTTSPEHRVVPPPLRCPHHRHIVPTTTTTTLSPAGQPHTPML